MGLREARQNSEPCASQNEWDRASAAACFSCRVPSRERLIAGGDSIQAIGTMACGSAQNSQRPGRHGLGRLGPACEPFFMLKVGELFGDGDVDELVQRDTLSLREILSNLSNRWHETKREFADRGFWGINWHGLYPLLGLPFSSSAGVKTSMLNRSADSRKSLVLLVMIAPALPLIATSRTISSSLSLDSGRYRNATKTGSAIASSASRTASVSDRDFPDARKCSARIATSRYSQASL